MKIVVRAGALATALDFVIGALATKAYVPALAGARINADACGATVGATDGEQYASATVADAVVENPGLIVLQAAALAGIAGGFATDAVLQITADQKVATVRCGQSRYRPALRPVSYFPPPFTIDTPVCSLILSRAEAQSLLGCTAFAASTEVSRCYLNGTHLHESDGAFVACATDCHRLARRAVPMPEHTGTWPEKGITVPNKAIKNINALVKNAADVEIVVGAPATARGSATLITARAGGNTLTSKLIDGTFPPYENFIPVPSNNSTFIDRADLINAVSRAAAVSTDQGLCLGITWSRGDTAVRLCLTRAVDAVIDEVRAETRGAARVALSATLLLEQLDAISGDTVRLDPGNHPGTPVLITDPTDATFLSLLMRMAWLAPAAEPVRQVGSSIATRP
jgi:DNA polymerase-3 subunit beta